MKHLQKLVTIVLAFVLALSLSLTALAEEDYGQEVTGAVSYTHLCWPVR